MGLRIREHRDRKRSELERHRQQIFAHEAERFKELAWSQEEAFEDFLMKLENIRQHIKNDSSALKIAKEVDKAIHLNPEEKLIHKDMLTAIILELL